MALDFHSHFVEVYRPLPRCLLCFFSPYTPKPASSNTRFLFSSLLLLLQFSRLPKKTCRTRNCSKIPQETWKVKVQKHIQRFVFNRLKYVLSTSLFACHCAHCSFFFFLLCSSQVGMIDIFVKSSLFSVSAEARAVFQRLIFAC